MVNVSGRLIDYWTGKPIVGATVMFGSVLATTNENGEYNVPSLSPSKYTVTIIHKDYERTTITADLSSEGAYTIEPIRVKPIFKAL